MLWDKRKPQEGGDIIPTINVHRDKPESPGQQEERYIIDPHSGEMIAETDIDGLIDLFERMQKASLEIDSTKYEIRRTLQAATDRQGITTKTRRVIGQARVAKVTLPSESYDQKILRSVWYAMPELAERYLRIEKISPQKREFKKLENAAGDERLEDFKSEVIRARKDPEGPGYVSIEK